MIKIPYGFESEKRIFLNDTKELVAFLYDKDDANLISTDDISSAAFTVLKPSDDPSLPSVDGEAGAVTEDGKATFLVPADIHDEVGDYRAFAQFTYDEGDSSDKVRTVPVVYEVCDVFQRVGATVADPAASIAWKKLEDCFDSDNGGPWLRDMTKANFDKNKILDFLPDVLLDINSEQPLTDYTADSFPWERDGAAFIGYGLFIQTVKHLMRSYVEQPTVTNSSVGYFDRTKYQAAWTAIYQVEKPEWDRIRLMWKRSELNIARGALLIGNKAGRLANANLRPRYGRGIGF